MPSAHADRTWIRGRGWHYEPFPGSQPTREQLDAAVAGSAGGDALLRRPQHLGELEGAGRSPASRRARPTLPNGTIVRDPKTGEPTGLLKESPASTLVTKLIPKPTRDEQRRASKRRSTKR